LPCTFALSETFGARAERAAAISASVARSFATSASRSGRRHSDARRRVAALGDNRSATGELTWIHGFSSDEYIYNKDIDTPFELHQYFVTSGRRSILS
jgi:hypothetical protein